MTHGEFHEHFFPPLSSGLDRAAVQIFNCTLSTDRSLQNKYFFSPLVQGVKKKPLWNLKSGQNPLACFSFFFFPPEISLTPSSSISKLEIQWQKQWNSDFSSISNLKRRESLSFKRFWSLKRIGEIPILSLLSCLWGPKSNGHGNVQ